MVPTGSSETVLPSRESDDNDEVAKNDAGEELARGELFCESACFVMETVSAER